MTDYKLSWQTDDDVLRQDARGEVFDRIMPIFTSDLGTSHCANGATELSRHPGYYEAGHIAAAFVEGCPIEVLRKRRRDLHTLTPRSRATRYYRHRRQQAAFDRFVDSLSMHSRPDADTREVVENLLLRLRLAADAGIISAAEAARLRLDAERRLRQIKRRRKVN